MVFRRAFTGSVDDFAELAAYVVLSGPRDGDLGDRFTDETFIRAALPVGAEKTLAKIITDGARAYLRGVPQERLHMYSDHPMGVDALTPMEGYFTYIENKMESRGMGHVVLNDKAREVLEAHGLAIARWYDKAA